MEEIVEQDTGEEEVGEDATPLPTQMQLLSTWEVKRMPHNCVTRCTRDGSPSAHAVHPFSSDSVL